MTLCFFFHRTSTTMAFAASSMPFSTARHPSTWPNIYLFPSSSRMSHSRNCMGRRSIRWQPLAARRRARLLHRIQRVSQRQLTIRNECGSGREDTRKVKVQDERTLQKCHFKLAAINIFYSTFNTFLFHFAILFPIICCVHPIKAPYRI